MHGGVRVGAADGLHEGGQIVIVIVAGFVIAHGRALRDLLRVLHGERDDAVHRPRGGIEELDGVERLADIAAAGLGDMARHAGLGDDGHAVARLEKVQRPVHRPLRLRLLHRLELKDRGARQDRIVDVEIRVFRRGGDESDLAVFDVFEQGLLLFFVEILDLVEVQEHPVRREEGIELGVDLLDVGGGRRRGVEFT